MSTFKIVVGQTPSQSKVFLNDQPVDGVCRVAFDLDARNMPFLKLEIYGEAIVEGEYVEEPMKSIIIDGARKYFGIPVHDPRDEMTLEEEQRAFAAEGVKFSRD